ncbi:nucleoside-diphosphate-sugar epimerase [Crossiella equi]|uniref:Nucleoside-diphosphate-sugar epimerase n=1 Tax=Crossiella equi TaxID=130796 RepID=A0ABS5A5W1_9PSEU|nr:NAD(P)-dependent oxidoreductase [Crossiella equi]MBP2471974.1 nucleoside-diphosphate-sugar epimerase [Crossiella equi]
MRFVVIGGTGFTGHHIVTTLLRAGHGVTVLTRTPGPHLPPGVATRTGDLTALHQRDVAELLAGHDGVVLAGSATMAHPRESTDVPAVYHRGNVAPVVKTLTAAREAGLDRAVLLGSYFATLHPLHPRLRLDRSPYVRSRLDQREQARRAAGDALSLTVLEIPYVAGATPGRSSVLARNMAQLTSRLGPLVWPGGTAVVSTTTLAEATLAGLTRQVHAAVPVADANLSWNQITRALAEAAGVRPVRVWAVRPWEGAVLTALSVLRGYRGPVSSYSPGLIRLLSSTELFVDLAAMPRTLGVPADEDALARALHDTAVAALSTRPA